jgi:putative component of membrane protein insertase Oxa1/YidC/SpoIIIJ protein YidD
MCGRVVPFLLCTALVWGLTAASDIRASEIATLTIDASDNGASTRYLYVENSFGVLCPESRTHGEDHVFLTLYQRKLSVRGRARCRFYPTCSAFYRESLDRYGCFWATLMLIDRMIYREHAWSLTAYPLHENMGLHRDPVHRNYILDGEGYYR